MPVPAEKARSESQSGVYPSYDRRAAEKQASRDADEKRLASGQVTLIDIEKKNAFLRADRTIVHWSKAKPL